MDEAAEREAKKRLRQVALAKRDCISPNECVAKSSAIVARLTSMPELKRAKTVMAYASFRSEVDTRSLVAWCCQQGKRVALTKVTGTRTMETFLIQDPPVDLEPGAWGIPEPVNGLERVDAAEVDIVIVPGSAFDPTGGRLGYGGGFYDAYLLGVRADVSLVGIAYETQVVDRVPTEPHDLRMDLIVTESRVHRVFQSPQRAGACEAATRATQ